MSPILPDSGSSDSAHSRSQTPSSPPERPLSVDFFLSAMEDERVTTLEETVTKLQARDIETQNKLDLLLASLARLTQSKEPTPEPFAPVKQDVPPPKTCTVHPASPQTSMETA